MDEMYSNFANTPKNNIFKQNNGSTTLKMNIWLMLMVYLVETACDVHLAVYHHGTVSFLDQGPEGQSIKQAPGRKTSPVWRCWCNVVAQPHQVIRKWRTAQSGHFSIAGGGSSAALQQCPHSLLLKKTFYSCHLGPHLIFPWAWDLFKSGVWTSGRSGSKLGVS